MRSSAVLALALVAAAGPAFAAPAAHYAKRQTPPAASTATSASSSPMQMDPASAALSLGPLLSLGGDLISGLSSLFGSHSSSRREELTMLARRANAGDQSAALALTSQLAPYIMHIIAAQTNQGVPVSQKREFARQVQDSSSTPASGALSLSALADLGKIGNDVIGGFETIFGGNNQNNKRDTSAASGSGQNGGSVPVPPSSTTTGKMVLPTTASGAIDIKSIISTVLQFLPIPFKREDLELLARDAGATPVAPSSTAPANMALPTTASGALDVGSIISTVLQFLPFPLKREELELLARDTGATPGAPSSTTTAKMVLPTTASGAIDISSIISTALQFLPFLKREDVELLAAREPLAFLTGQTDSPLPDFSKFGLNHLSFGLNELD